MAKCCPPSLGIQASSSSNRMEVEHNNSVQCTSKLPEMWIPKHLSTFPLFQAQLRAFIPEMLKYSTGRGKPGWGKESCKPIWWPEDIPWANVRSDVRTEEQKQRVGVSPVCLQMEHCRMVFGSGFSLEGQKEESVSWPPEGGEGCCALLSSRELCA